MPLRPPSATWPAPGPPNSRGAASVGLLALYDGAEVLLKPVFGSLADRIGGKPVLLGGLISFAAASALYAVADSPGWLWAARLGQGASASAFSP
ncbi:MFS transporter [Streptomyces sp. NBC_01361]|uniref:MFS transporter n=1 Tax=Streptomyces sp. NBC_01361 TaxID=2903838 RepID=UPI003FCD54C3